MVRINERVKIGFYSPSKYSQPIIPERLIPYLKESGRYKSVDKNKTNNKTIGSIHAKSKIETSLSKFVRSPSNNFGRDWIINERPDEKLKRDLRFKKRELKLQMQK